ncbi:MAG TPA: RNA methyltransferase [Verrucomicrobiae bacterium]|nr:RNA methyltransferase [Verrucomicrobiae bacterium]
MLRIQKITTLDPPELAPYRTMRRQFEQREQGIFVAEGEKVVRRLLESALTVVSVLLPEKWLREYEPLLEARPEEIHAYVAEKNLLEQLTGFSMYQGVLAVGKVPPAPNLEAVLQAAPRPRLLAAVDGLSNAENLGTLVRNCGAFGVQALLVSRTSSSPFLRRAVRSSMGVIFRLPVIEGIGLSPAICELRKHDVRCVAAHPHANGRALSQADLSGDCCIVFGSEGQGLSPGVLESCNDAVAVPMPADVDSLNVGSAAAVFFYEAARQRGRA